MLLLQEAVDPTDISSTLKGRVSLLCMAVECVDRLMRLTPADDFTRQHATVVVSELGSLLYHAYNQLCRLEREGDILNDAYSLLRELQRLNAIEWPTINIGREQIEVADRGRVLGDVIGRLRALEWFRTDSADGLSL